MSSTLWWLWSSLCSPPSGSSKLTMTELEKWNSPDPAHPPATPTNTQVDSYRSQIYYYSQIDILTNTTKCHSRKGMNAFLDFG